MSNFQISRSRKLERDGKFTLDLSRLVNFDKEKHFGSLQGTTDSVIFQRIDPILGINSRYILLNV